MSIREELSKFTSDQLQNELKLREKEAKDKLKDRSNRTFYRQAEGTFRTLKEKIKIVKTLTEEQQDTVIDYKNKVYYLDKETDEERDLRLTRTAFADENYDQCTAYFYEGGKQVGYANTTMLSEAQYYADLWENDSDITSEDDWQEEYLGHNGFHFIELDCADYTRN